MFRRARKTAQPSRTGSEDRFIYPATAVNPRFRTFFDYWRSKAVGGKLPGRQHIDPLEMRTFLPNLGLVDVVREGPRTRFRVRLFGTGLFPLWQTDLTGRWLDEFIPPAQRDVVEADLMKIVTSG